jgi:hypothetical protein
VADPSPFAEMLGGRGPHPGIESAVLAARLGVAPVEAILADLGSWPLLTLSTDDPRDGLDQIRPLLLQGADGIPVIACFTAPDRARAFARPDLFPVRVPGFILAAGARPGVGIVVNPGSQPAIAIAPEEIAGVAVARPEPTPDPAGSRALHPAELALAAAARGAGSPAELRARLRDAQLFVASGTDPGMGAPTLATESAGGVESVLVWTDRDLITQVPEPHWLIAATGRDLPTMLRAGTRVRVDAGTVFEADLSVDDLG